MKQTAINGIQLNSVWVEYASHFNKTIRNDLQKQFSTVNKEAKVSSVPCSINVFVANCVKKFARVVGEPVLSYCVDSIHADNELLFATLNDAVKALDPSKALV